MSEHDGMPQVDRQPLFTLQAIRAQHRLPCLVRLIGHDTNESNDNYCLLLCETQDPYLIVSNEADRFSIPISFDGTYFSLFVTLSNMFEHRLAHGFDGGYDI
jgi:hypothetical protein